MLLDNDRDRNIDFLGKKVSIFCRTHIAVGHRIQEGRPGPLWLRSAAARTQRDRPFSAAHVIVDHLRLDVLFSGRQAGTTASPRTALAANLTKAMSFLWLKATYPGWTITRATFSRWAEAEA